MKKWNNAELIELNINATASGPKHGPKELQTSTHSENWHHARGTDPDCIQCTTDDHNDVINDRS